MSYIVGQSTVPSNSTVPVLTVPSGYVSGAIYSLSTAPTYLGTSNVVSPARGMLLNSVPVPLSSFISSGGATFWGANTAAVSTVVNWVLTNGQA